MGAGAEWMAPFEKAFVEKDFFEIVFRSFITRLSRSNIKTEIDTAYCTFGLPVLIQQKNRSNRVEKI